MIILNKIVGKINVQFLSIFLSVFFDKIPVLVEKSLVGLMTARVKNICNIWTKLSDVISVGLITWE
jgi:hypothetical protein